MNKPSDFNRALIRLGVAAAIGCMLAGPGLAGVQDSVFFVSPDGGNVTFDVRDVSRREVLQRLLSSKAIELEWVDQAFAEERISGAFNGTTDSVLQRLLKQTDFVAVYDHDKEKTRIVRLIIIGKGASASVALPETSAAAAEAPVLKPVPSPIDLTPRPTADMTVLPSSHSKGSGMTPAPGVGPPLLIPYAGPEALPLVSPPLGATATTLVPPSSADAARAGMQIPAFMKPR